MGARARAKPPWPFSSSSREQGTRPPRRRTGGPVPRCPGGVMPEEEAAPERRFRALVEQSWDALTLVDPGGTVLYASPAVRRVFGAAPEALVGRALEERIHPEDRARWAALLAEAGRAAGTTVRGEY